MTTTGTTAVTPHTPRKRAARRLVEPGVTGVTAVVPVVVVSEANQRCHWAARHRRFKEQAQAVAEVLCGHGFGASFRGGRPVTVTLTRLGGNPMDGDNLAGAFKGIRDFVALWLGVNDGSSLVDWTYRQEKATASGVRIEVSLGPTRLMPAKRSCRACQRMAAENESLRRIAADLHWMARRYCDGRRSYATGTFNDHTRALLALGVPLNATADRTIWAADGMGRAYDGLSEEEATPGTDAATGTTEAT